jgi:hypothetical protein
MPVGREADRDEACGAVCRLGRLGFVVNSVP